MPLIIGGLKSSGRLWHCKKVDRNGRASVEKGHMVGMKRFHVSLLGDTNDLSNSTDKSSKASFSQWRKLRVLNQNLDNRRRSFRIYSHLMAETQILFHKIEIDSSVNSDILALRR
jgi:hypothetical protein